MKKINLIHGFISTRKSHLRFLILLGVLSEFFALLIPISVGKFYELCLETTSLRAQVLNVLPFDFLNSIYSFLIYFSIIISIRYLLGYQFRKSSRSFTELFIKFVKDQLFSHQLRISFEEYEKTGTSKYLLRYSGDINSLKNYFIKWIIESKVKIIVLFIGLFWLIYLNAIGGILFTILAIAFFIWLNVQNKLLEKISLQKRNYTSGQLSYVNRSLKAIKTIKSNVRENEVEHDYKKRTQKIYNKSVQFAEKDSLIRNTISFFQYLVLVPIMLVFYNDVESGQFSGAVLVSFILLYLTILPVIRFVFRLPSVYKLGQISISKLNKILRLPIDVVNENYGVYNNPRVVFKSFKIDGHSELNQRCRKKNINTVSSSFTDFNFIQNIFHGLKEESYKGSIEINGIDIKSISHRTLRENVSILSSSTVLIGRYVKDCFGSLSKSSRNALIQEKLNKLKKAFNLEFELPPKRFIGENGNLLSNYEYEILILAIALIQNKRIIILLDLPYLLKRNKTKLFEILKETNSSVLYFKNL